MKPLRLVCMLCSVFLFAPLSPSAASDATPQEVMAKVKEAVSLVSSKGEACFPEFDDPTGKWVWGGTYVFIMKCDETMLATHPIKPKLIGRDLSTIKDKYGNYFFSQMCEEAKKPEGGWTEYYWPKPGETEQSRKISFVLPIPGTPYQAGAGLYDNTISIDELKKMKP
jgi:cytochrome c